MRRLFLVFLFLIVSPFSFSKENISWKNLLPGLQQTTWVGKDSQGSPVTLELFKIDPKQFRLELVQAQDFGQTKITAKEMVQKTGGLLAVNAGFFDPGFKPLGLLVKNGQQLNPLRSVAWWGIFSLDKWSGPEVSRPEEFQMRPSTELAIQVGPRLVDNGKPLPVKHNDSQKTFIGITKDHQIVLGVTELCAVDAVDFAQILSRDLQLKEALNFDGGSSTQLYGKISSYQKDLPGITAVANGVVVVRR